MQPWRDSINTKVRQTILLIIMLLLVNNCQKMGPYNIEIRSIENCGPKKDYGLVFEPHIRKFNRTVFILDSSIQFYDDWDDSLTMIVDMALFTNNGWKENYYRQSFPKACSVVKMWGGEMFASALKIVGAKSRCPLPKGNYTMKNWVLKLEVPSIPVWHYNRYRWRGSLTKNSELIGCIAAVVDVVPKKRH